MRHAAAAMQHLLINDPPVLEHERDAQHARDCQLVREAVRKPSVRRRAGEALIAFGVRLAGEPVSKPLANPASKPQRRLAGRSA
jgi:hypothetical protein